MAKPLSPALKGLITAVLMIGSTLVIDRYKEMIDPRVQYLIYLLYALGIAWALYNRAGLFFGELFGLGFRCFIVVTLLMVVFTYIFIRAHPSLAAEEALQVKEYYEQKKDKTAPEIEQLAQKAKKQYPITVISISIFRYLIVGVVITASLSALFMRRA